MCRLLFAMLLLGTVPAMADTCPAPGAAGQKDAVPLCAVVNQVTSALARYQSSLGSGANALPPLSKAEFDFKTAAVTTTGAKISLFVFTIGGSHERDVTNDVTFTYALPKPKPAALAPQTTALPRHSGRQILLLECRVHRRYCSRRRFAMCDPSIDGKLRTTRC